MTKMPNVVSIILSAQVLSGVHATSPMPMVRSRVISNSVELVNQDSDHVKALATLIRARAVRPSQPISSEAEASSRQTAEQVAIDIPAISSAGAQSEDSESSTSVSTDGNDSVSTYDTMIIHSVSADDANSISADDTESHVAIDIPASSTQTAVEEKSTTVVYHAEKKTPTIGNGITRVAPKFMAIKKFASAPELFRRRSSSGAPSPFSRYFLNRSESSERQLVSSESVEKIIARLERDDELQNANKSSSNAQNAPNDEFFHQCIFCFSEFQKDSNRGYPKCVDSQRGTGVAGGDSRTSIHSSTRMESARLSKQSQSARMTMSQQPTIITPCGHKFHTECLRKDMKLKLREKAKQTGIDPIMDHRCSNLMQCPHPFCDEDIPKIWAIDQGLIDRGFVSDWKKVLKQVALERRLAVSRHASDVWVADSEFNYNDPLYVKKVVCIVISLLCLVCGGGLVMALLKVANTI